MIKILALFRTVAGLGGGRSQVMGVGGGRQQRQQQMGGIDGRQKTGDGQGQEEEEEGVHVMGDWVGDGDRRGQIHWGLC